MPEYFRTRASCVGRAIELLRAHDGPAVVGFDFPMGYPSLPGGGRVMPEGRTLAAMLAERIEDRDDDRNNRFEVAAALNVEIASGLGSTQGPFWGCTIDQPRGLLRTRPDPFPVPEYRPCEIELRAAGYRPQSAWKLAYPASVGSQTLTGMARVHEMLTHRDLGPRCWIWPFEAPPARSDAIAIAEVWPGLSPFDAPEYTRVSEIRDARQVLATRDSLRAIDPGARNPACTGGWILNADPSVGRPTR